MTGEMMEDLAARRARIVAQRRQETGIDEAMIDRLVRTFYGKVRLDPMLGPVFEARVQDWEHHFQILGAFWSSVTLGTGAYSGTPMQKHVGLPVDGRHFDRWLRLFGITAIEICPPDAARLFIERAMRIAESLELAIAGDLKIMLGKGERLHRPALDIEPALIRFISPPFLNAWTASGLASEVDFWRLPDSSTVFVVNKGLKQ